MIEVIAALLLFALMILIVTALTFVFARGVMWWESRRRPVPASPKDAWEYSCREGNDDRGRAA